MSTSTGRGPVGQRRAVLDGVPGDDDALVEHRRPVGEPLAEADDAGVLEQAEVLHVVDVAVGVHVGPPQRHLDAVGLGIVGSGHAPHPPSPVRRSAATGAHGVLGWADAAAARRRPPTSTTSSPPHSATAGCRPSPPGWCAAASWSGAARPARSTGAPTVDAADADTQYRMGSITKTFVAVCVLRLRDAGRLELTDRFGAHVPGSALDDVTIEQLLTHAAGTQAETPGPWWERTPGGDWDALVASPVGQRFRAGRRFHYSNVGYAALGRLLEVHHGRGWFDVVRDELLEPLGMTRTTTRPSGPAALGPGRAPVRRRAAARARARRRRDGTGRPAVDDRPRPRPLGDASSAARPAGLLSADTLAEMVEPHHVVDDPGQPWVGGARPGLPGVERRRRPVRRPRRVDARLPRRAAGAAGCRCAGGGSASAVPRCRRHGIRPAVGAAGDGVVLFTNTTASTATRSLIDDLLDGLARHEPAPVEPWSASGDPALLELVGTWHWGPGDGDRHGRSASTSCSGEPGAGRGARFRPVGRRPVARAGRLLRGRAAAGGAPRRRVGVAPRPRVVPVHPHAVRPAGRRARRGRRAAAGPEPRGRLTPRRRRAPRAGGRRRPPAGPRSRARRRGSHRGGWGTR